MSVRKAVTGMLFNLTHFYFPKGMMGTHDEDTYRYFKDSDVICENVPRQKKSWLGLGNEFVSTMYTHHQKTVICDADIGDGSGRRRLIGNK